jgi:hypothetical protein
VSSSPLQRSLALDGRVELRLIQEEIWGEGGESGRRTKRASQSLLLLLLLLLA